MKVLRAIFLILLGLYFFVPLLIGGGAGSEAVHHLVDRAVAAGGYRTGDLIRELAASEIFHGKVEPTFRK